MAKTFPEKLAASILARGNPVCVGIDPDFARLPAPLVADRRADRLADRVAAIREFCLELIDVIYPLVPIVKPQAAYFERLGPLGMQVLGEVIMHARKRGLLVLLDGKRNDIGSTATAYAEGILGADSPWGADALTVSPYLGDDSLRPFVDLARERDGGIFVLVKTSNPGGGQFQDLLVDGEPVYRHVARYVESLARETATTSVNPSPAAKTSPYGAVGAVVGATYPEQLSELRAIMPHAWLLVPGFGAQGAGARDVAGAFDATGSGALINNSRGINFAHAQKPYSERFSPEDWRRAVEGATLDMIDLLKAETPAGKLPRAKEARP